VPVDGMRPAARLVSLLLLLLCAEHASCGRVRNALFGSGLFSSGRNAEGNGDYHTDADQKELIAFLKAEGFGKYATKEYIAKMDDVLAHDSIEDMTHLVADDEYSEIGMEREDALHIQKAARREMLKRFLASVPLPEGKPADFYQQHLDALIKAGYDEPDDVADLDEEEAQGLGIDAEHINILVNYAEEYETRELLQVILVTLVDAKGATPYSAESAWRPIVDALVKAGIRSLNEVSQRESVPGVPQEDLHRLQNDARLLQYAQKQEL